VQIFDAQQELTARLEAEKRNAKGKTGQESGIDSSLYRDNSSFGYRFDFLPVYVLRDAKQELKPFYRGK
jgi:hypothetical protein